MVCLFEFSRARKKYLAQVVMKKVKEMKMVRYINSDKRCTIVIFLGNVITYTDPVIAICTDCGQTFRTHVPGTDCKLPNGGIMCHQDPQISCPDCDFSVVGAMLNTDLFPHLKSRIP